MIGTDQLGQTARGPCTFAYLGVNPMTTTGELVFYKCKTNELLRCELVHAPTTHTNQYVMPTKDLKVHFADKKLSVADLIALINNQGQCL